MILVWNGAGILVAVIWFVSVLTGDNLAVAMFGPQASHRIHNLTVQCLAAILTLLLAVVLRTQRSIGFDPETGADVIVRPNHSLFWIPVNVWPAIFLAIGIVGYFQTPAPSPVLFEVTPLAASKIRQEAAAMPLAREWYVRVEAYWPKGVCSPQYSVEIVTTLNRARDYEFEAIGINILVLKRQVDMFRGAKLDYEEKAAEGFRVDNPNFQGDQLEKWRRDLELERLQ